MSVAAVKHDPIIVTAFLKAMEQGQLPADGTNRLITLSRQVGAQGEEIAARAAQLLTEASQGKEPWIVVDRDIAERVSEDHHLPGLIKSFFTGDQMLSMGEHLQGILGISALDSTMIEKMTETIIRLARIGHVILIGRAAHVITAQFPRALHVRVIGSLDRRAERVAAQKGLSEHAAQAEVKRVDHDRNHFVSTYFHTQLDDVSHYDMIFNTDRVTVEEGALLLAHLVNSPNFRNPAATKLQELRHQVLG